MSVGRTILQSLIGLVTAVAAFVGGLFVASRIPGTGVKWLNELGEMVVGAVIFVCCLSVGLALRLRAESLLITAGLVLAFLVAVSELSENWDYTALPVALSAAVVFIVGVIKQYVFPRKC